MWPRWERPPPPRLLTAHGGKIVGNIGWGGRFRALPLWVSRGVRVTETSLQGAFRRILRVIAPILGKNVGIRTLAYGRETCIASLCGHYARWANDLREEGGTGSWVLTESDEPKPREERCRGGGSNGVYEFIFCIKTRSREAWGFYCTVKACFLL